MSEYLSLKEIIKGPKKGDIVFVRTPYPEINGIYQIKKRLVTSNFPYQVEHEGYLQLLRKHQVKSLGKII